MLAGVHVLPHLSIACKLYAIFAFLAVATLALAAVAVTGVYRQAALTAEFGSAYAGTTNVERVNTLIYAVVTETYGIYGSSDAQMTKKHADALTTHNDRIGQVVAEWRKTATADNPTLFEGFSRRIREFQEFRRELVRRSIEVGPAAAREWGDDDTNNDIRRALNEDIEALADAYADRAQGIYAEIDRNIRRMAGLLSLLATAAVLLAVVGIFIIARAIAKPLAKIADVTQAVAAGDSRTSVPYRGRRDEIGALARSIDVFQQAMNKNQELTRAATDEAALLRMCGIVTTGSVSGRALP